MKFWLALLSCLLLIPAIEAQTPASKPHPNCTVQGQVIQEPGGLPIRKADIRLLGADDEERGETKYATITDPQGRFKIEDIEPGNYRLYFDHAGFVDAEKRRHGSGMLLPLGSGQEVTGLLFHMFPAAVITGKVTDNDGDPVPNVNVAAIPYDATLRGVSQIVGGRTDDKGEYRIGGLPPKRYLIMAQPLSQLVKTVQLEKKDDKSVATYAITYYPGTIDKSQAIPIALRAGDEMPANISLGFVHPVHVRGVVTNFPAAASGEFSVVLRPQDDDTMAVIEAWPLDKAGGFDIRGVLPGAYNVLLVSGSPEALRVMRGDQTVRVSNTDVDGLRILPLANDQVRGQLRMDNSKKIDWSQFALRLYSNRSAPGGAYTASGNGLEALYWDEEESRAEVKPDGSFEMKNVPAGSYRLQVSSSRAMQDYFLKAVNLQGNDVSDSGFTVGTSDLLDIVLSPNGARVEGVANDEKGDPVSDVQIICIPDANRRERRDLYKVVATDRRGRFSLHGLNPGEYRVIAVDADVDESDVNPEFIREHESLGETVKLEEGTQKTIVLKLAVPND